MTTCGAPEALPSGAAGGGKMRFQLKGGHIFEVDSRYEVGKRLGQGSYGTTAEAVDRVKDETVAIKRVSHALADASSCKAMLREIRLMKHFNHENILGLRDIMTPPSDGSPWTDVYLVLEMMDTDLHYILHSKQALSAQHVQWITYQLLRGLKAIHSAKALHRDLKPSNLLVNRNVDLKICDFGMARGVDASRSPQRRAAHKPDDSTHNNRSRDNGSGGGGSESMEEPEELPHAPLTEYVVTRHYRAPELLVQNREYDEGIDMWSVGCILAECLMRKVLFPGRDYLHQTKLIVEAIGCPPADQLPRLVENLAAREYLTQVASLVTPTPVAARVPEGTPPEALSLLERLLAFDSAERPGAAEALGDAFLRPFHGLNAEPEAAPFDFDFEVEGVSEEQLRQLVWDEMHAFHAPEAEHAAEAARRRGGGSDDSMEE